MYYHATDYKNLDRIMSEGIKPGCDGVVYLAETPEDVLKFVAFRNYKDILVLAVDVDKVEETFDHSLSFFKCRAYGTEWVSPDKINLEESLRYENPFYKDLCTLNKRQA